MRNTLSAYFMVILLVAILLSGCQGTYTITVGRLVNSAEGALQFEDGTVIVCGASNVNIFDDNNHRIPYLKIGEIYEVINDGVGGHLHIIGADEVKLRLWQTQHSTE